MKILTLIGTRPELIRLNIIIEKLDQQLNKNHIFVFSRQNYDHNLSDIFFKRKPDYQFNIKHNTFAEFISKSIIEFEEVLEKEKPDKILTLGDTNTGLLTILAKRKNIPIYHMEAGNRCFDSRVPEEINRRIIDNISTVNMPYTDYAYQNLISEGFDRTKIFKIGNPIFEVISKLINLQRPYSYEFNTRSKEFILVTIHRSENVDNPKVLSQIFNAILKISDVNKVIVSLHPRTASKLDINKYKNIRNLKISKPFNFEDFIMFEKHARIILTDSGTVQEEACILGTPCLVIRNSTERQETIDCGASILTGTDYYDILNGYIRFNKTNNNLNWEIPLDYLKENVSDTVINILFGK